MVDAGDKPAFLFISSFPPPFGGVSIQARSIAESSWRRLGAQPYVLDLKRRTIFAFDGTDWHDIGLLTFKAFFANIGPLLGTVWTALRVFGAHGLVRVDRYLVWRLGLLAIAALTRVRLCRAPVFVYSFHVGAPSLVGGMIAAATSVPHFKAVFGEPLTNREKLVLQRDVILATGGNRFYHPCSRHCDQLLQDVLPGIQSTVLYYGSDLNELASGAAAAKKGEQAIAGRPIRILYLGRIEEEMGILFFLELSRQLEASSPGRFTFTVCGQRGAHSETVQTFRAHFTGQLAFRESVSMEERNDLLVASDILLVPSVNERACFGLAIVEGMAARSFVLARDIGGHREAALERGDNLFDRDAGPNELAARVEQVADRLCAGELLVTLQGSSAAVTEAFDIRRCVNKQLDVIAAAVQNGAA